jgi:transposase
MEACGGAHHWARALASLRHQVKLMPSRFVQAFNIGNKDDTADARAIWLAAQQLCKAVAVKTEAQQAVLSLHRMRQQLVKFRAAQVNNLRGLLTEYGEAMGAGRATLNHAMPEVLARLADRLPAVMIDTLREQWTNLTELDKRIVDIEHRLAQWMKQEPAVKAIGVGLLTATAAIATMGNANVFRLSCEEEPDRTGVHQA